MFGLLDLLVGCGISLAVGLMFVMLLYAVWIVVF